MTHYNKTQRQVAIFLAASSLILGILLAYYLKKFHKLRKEVVIIKRRGRIVIAYTICAIIILSVIYPFIVLLHSQNIVSDKESNTFKSLNFTADLILTPFYYVALSLILVRFWLIYYDFCFSHSCFNLKWKECISSSMADLNEDRWFVLHRGDYGNANYIIKRVIILCLCMVCGSLSTMYLFRFGIINIKLWHGFNAIMFGIILCVLLTLKRDWPTIGDSIYLFPEMKLIAIIWINGLMLYVLCIIVRFFIYNATTIMLIQLMGIIGIFSIPFPSTFWVLKQLKIDTLKPLDTMNSYKDVLSLDKILKEQRFFDGFMQHLIKEFCMENLLALIEFVQFREFMIDVFDIDEEILGNVATNFDYEFPPDVPLSDIVFDVDGDQEKIDKHTWIRMKAHRLYTKYIRLSSEFE